MKRPIRLTLAAYTHLGARGLKGIGMFHLAQEAWRRGYLRRVIAISRTRCDPAFDWNLVSTPPGEALSLRVLETVRRRVWKGFPTRLTAEGLLDHYAASRLDGHGGILVATTGMVRTTERAKALGYTTVLYGGNPHPAHIVRETESERRRLGLEPATREPGRHRIMRRLTRQIARSDYILALSEFAKQTYVEEGVSAARVLVAPLGVDAHRFQATPTPTGDPFTFLFVGHVTDTTALVKGLQYLLEAWRELDLSNARLVVCGKMGGEARELIRRFASSVRPVEFTGPVKDPGPYFRAASVFVFPSLAEGFAKVVLEAMACGRPVIATPISGPVLRDGVDGLYVPSRDVRALKEAMAHVHRHRELLTRMGASARERAEEYSWQRFGRRVAEIVEEIWTREGLVSGMSA